MDNRHKILVVDDELGPRESIRMILLDRYNIVTAENGKRALELLKNEEFDLVILDIRMPDINGIDLLSEIKSRFPDTEVVMITAYASLNTATNALRYGALDYLMKPFDRASVLDVVEKGLSRRSRIRENRSMYNELLQENVTLQEEIECASENIQKHYLETVNSLVAAIDAKDSYTKNHQENVSALAVILGTEMGIPAGYLGVLQQAAILHDIGKIGVPENILMKPDVLTREEFDILKQHPIIGARIVSPVQFLKDVVPIILHHHERFDGSGYPDGLKGEEIPLGARIIAIADAVDAMLSDRPYAGIKSIEEVKENLVVFSGTQFDPEIVDISLKIDLPSRRSSISK